MESKYEVISIIDNSPLNIFLHKVKYVANHWHDHLEILFVLQGKVNVIIYDKQFSLMQEDLLLINMNEVHSIQAEEDNLLLALQIPYSFLKENYPDIDQIDFECKSFTNSITDRENYNKVRGLLAELMLIHSKGEYGGEIVVKIKALTLEIIYLLVSSFSRKRQSGVRMSNKYRERLLLITKYIQENYTRDIGLADIAELENLSLPHISNFFQKYMGMSFSKYLSKIRMEKAVREIVLTDLPITKIALDQGFPNLKSFHKTFKEIFNTTPAQYRKGQKDVSRIHDKEDSIPQYLDYNRENAYASLFKYLHQPGPDFSTFTRSDGRNVNYVKIESQNPEVLRHTWNTLCSIGKAKEGLYTQVQQQLRMIQDRIGFRYIRFHGIFDDEMMVYQENAVGEVVFSFTYVDQLFDFLLGIGLRPFLEFGFTPIQLASTNHSVFHKKSNISKPCDQEKWNQLIRSFIVHCINRYGLEEVAEWYFEIWNEPDITAFWNGSFEEYCRFYQDSYQTIKSVCVDLKVGGPAITCESLWKSDFLEKYLDYCHQSVCLPDFLTLHSYPAGMADMLHQLDYPAVQEENSESYLCDSIRLAKDKLKYMNLEGMDIHIAEWNSTPSHRELTNDTCYKAAYIVKNIIDNLDQAASVCYWASTDLLEELPLAPQTFHGGLGLLTYNGIKKPGFYAYELLAKLGNELVAKGPGYCLTKKRGNYQLLVYNYCHINKFYGTDDLLGINEVNRYHVFSDTKQWDISFSVYGIPSGKYILRKNEINRRHGSAFDLWITLGAPRLLTMSDIEYLNAKSLPKQTVMKVEIQDSWNLICNLSPHEVQLFELTPVCGDVTK